MDDRLRPGPPLGNILGGFTGGQAALFQEQEGQAAELLPVVAGDDGLLVGLGDGHRIAPRPSSHCWTSMAGQSHSQKQWG